MPSPLGHALAGLAAAWGSDFVPRPPQPANCAGKRFFLQPIGGLADRLACVGLAVAPDLDLVIVNRTGLFHTASAP